jgi:hypothetical protein
MGPRIRKIIMWTVGMAFVGALLASKGSYATTWYGAFLDNPAWIFGGASIGLILGFIFSLRLPVSK